MRILQVTPVFYPALAYGGIVRVAHELSKRLVKRGHEVTVYTTDANMDSRVNENVDEIDGVEIHYFKNISNSLAWNHRLFVSPSMIPIIKKQIKNFDTTHIHDFRTFQNIIVHHYAKKNGIPYILQTHGSITSDISKQTIKKCFDALFGHRILNGAYKVLALNNTEAEKCKKVGANGCNIEVISNGISLAEYENLPRRGEFKEKYGINEKIVLYIGRIEKSKKIDLLVTAFAGISKILDDIKLVIVGPDDGYLSTLKKLSNYLKIIDKVLFTGFISDKDKLSAYIDAEAFVMPSFYGFPLTFLEAMVCEVPILTTNKGDFIEGIDNEIGFVVEYNKEELETALLKILIDEKLRNEFKRNAKEKIKEYDWDIVVNIVEKVYKKVVEEIP